MEPLGVPHPLLVWVQGERW